VLQPGDILTWYGKTQHEGLRGVLGQVQDLRDFVIKEGVKHGAVYAATNGFGVAAAWLLRNAGRTTLSAESVSRLLPRGHVFESHAHEWFGVMKKGWQPTDAQVDEWMDICERVARSKRTFDHTLKGGSRVTGHFAYVDGKPFVVYFYEGTDIVATAIIPRGDQLSNILREISR
jgi:hypothetical protein